MHALGGLATQNRLTCFVLRPSSWLYWSSQVHALGGLATQNSLNCFVLRPGGLVGLARLTVLLIKTLNNNRTTNQRRWTTIILTGQD